MKKKITIVLLIMMMLFTGVLGASAEGKLTLQNVVFQDDGTLDLIVSVPTIDNLQPADFSVSANTEAIEVKSVSSIGRSDVVTHWVFLVDLSMSAASFETAMKTLPELINLLPEKDMAAVMTTEMSAYNLQWTNDKAALKAQAGLKRNGNAKQLNAAVASAVTLFEDQTTYERPCIVILSDGENDDVEKSSNLISQITDSNVTVYAYAFELTAGNRDNDKIENYGAYATSSAGGAMISVEYGERDNAQANAKKLEQNEQYFRVVKLAKSSLPESVSSFEVIFRLDNNTLLADDFALSSARQLAYKDWKNAQSVIIISEPTPGPTDMISGPTTQPTPDPTNMPTADPTDPPPDPTLFDKIIEFVEENPIVILGVVLVALLVVLLVVLTRKKPVEEQKTEIRVDRTVIHDNRDNGATVVDMEPAKMMIRLIRTDDRSVYTMAMNETLIVGRKAPEADMVISGDEKLSRVHARISFANGVVVLENLGANGTYVNGKKIDRPVQLHQQDILKMGEKLYQISWHMQ